MNGGAKCLTFGVCVFYNDRIVTVESESSVGNLLHVGRRVDTGLQDTYERKWDVSQERQHTQCSDLRRQDQ
jgi:hypothetical protein